jgi:hypothetical protein
MEGDGSDRPEVLGQSVVHNQAAALAKSLALWGRDLRYGSIANSCARPCAESITAVERASPSLPFH